MAEVEDTVIDDSTRSFMENAPHPIETDFELGQDNINPLGLDIHNPVFLISGLSIAGFVLITLMFQTQATEFFGWLRPFLTSTFDWFFLSAANIFVLFCLMLLVFLSRNFLQKIFPVKKPEQACLVMTST